MFNFFHPKSVVESRAVAVMVVQQEASTLQDTRALIVTARNAGPTALNVKDRACEK